MSNRWAIGGVAIVAAAAGGFGFATYEDVRTIDGDIDAELHSLTVRQRMMDADILDGSTDLSLYAESIANGAAIISAIRTKHPIGSIVRADRIRRIEDGYAAMRLNYETYNEAEGD